MNVELKRENDWMTCREMDTRSYRIPAVSVLEWDAVLLSGFAKVKPGERVVDLGTGTGIYDPAGSKKQGHILYWIGGSSPESADMASRSVQLNDLQERGSHCKWRY